MVLGVVCNEKVWGQARIRQLGVGYLIHLQYILIMGNLVQIMVLQCLSQFCIPLIQVNNKNRLKLSYCFKMLLLEQDPQVPITNTSKQYKLGKCYKRRHLHVFIIIYLEVLSPLDSSAPSDLQLIEAEISTSLQRNQLSTSHKV